MSNNNRRGAIQLPTTEQDSHQSPFPRSSLRWSIPCCTSFPLINGRSGVIRLPEDSDEDEDQQSDEFIIPIEAITKAKHGYLQSQAIDHLSRNPFARVTKTYEQNEHEEESPIGEDDDNDLLENASQQTLREEELVNLDKNSINRNINDVDVTEDEGYSVEIDTDEEDNIATNSLESSDTQQEATTSHLASDTEEQNKTLLDDKVPQIEEDILQHLPLPRLSQEIPKDMIHQKLLSEKLICDEEPLVSTRSVNEDDKDNYSSLLSINEEEPFVATKDDGKNEQKSAELNNDTLAVENELAIGDIASVSSPLPNEQVKPSFSSAPSQKMMIMKPTASQENHSDKARERRSSVVATATQSILGDKLEDFTEKLAFIKKTIIMNIDSSDEEEELNSSDRYIKKKETINQPVKSTNRFVNIQSFM
ncbi:MAG: hypothetical protein EXX96DRAFT_17186 [Benjaminiella poitrasii]|nr:MAG: hypothetical protein EXX96DRAFT_17186 [Benjaminiella poitrasii]